MPRQARTFRSAPCDQCQSRMAVEKGWWQSEDEIAKVLDGLKQAIQETKILAPTAAQILATPTTLMALNQAFDCLLKLQSRNTGPGRARRG